MGDMMIRRVLARTLVVAALVAGCGLDGQRDMSVAPEAEEDVIASVGDPTTPTDGGEPVHYLEGSVGVFQLNGYTFDVSWELSEPDVTVNRADAPPGQVFIDHSFAGTLTFRNTTEGRNNLIAFDGLPNVRLAWPLSDVPAESQEQDCAPYGLVVAHGLVHCQMAVVVPFAHPGGKGAAALELAPDEVISTTVTSVPMLFRLSASDTSEAIDAVLKMFERPPSLVLFSVGGLPGSMLERCGGDVYGIADGSGRDLMVSEATNRQGSRTCTEALQSEASGAA